jgi:hypothetical protein
MTTPTSPSATAGPILDLDPGQYKAVACAYPGDPAGDRGEHRDGPSPIPDAPGTDPMP